MQAFLWTLIGGLAILVGVVFASKLKFVATFARFAYPNALLIARGNPYITKSKLGALLELKFSEALSALPDYEIQRGPNADIDVALDKALVRCIDEVISRVPKGMKPFFRAYLKKYEIRIIENAILSKLLGEAKETIEQKLFPVGAITKETITELIEAENAVAAAELFDVPGLVQAVKDYKTDFFAVQSALDRHFFEELKITRPAKSLRVPVNFFISNLIDIVNVKVLLRAKRAGYDAGSSGKLLVGTGRELAKWKLDEMADAADVPEVISALEGTSYISPLKNAMSDYETEKDMWHLEAALDTYLLEFVIDLNAQYFGTVGPSIMYVVAKEYEIQNLRAILCGLREEMPSDDIRALLISAT